MKTKEGKKEGREKVRNSIEVTKRIVEKKKKKRKEKRRVEECWKKWAPVILYYRLLFPYLTASMATAMLSPPDFEEHLHNI